MIYTFTCLGFGCDVCGFLVVFVCLWGGGVCAGFCFAFVVLFVYFGWGFCCGFLIFFKLLLFPIKILNYLLSYKNDTSTSNNIHL